ncbi:MAG: ABC transporter substrate-binding protein [Anaerolineae bacterium]|nr:ABC transporter substrate-binding protein [Anaerolineae bacterium]
MKNALLSSLFLVVILTITPAFAQDNESRQIAVIVSSVGSDATRDRLAYQAAVLAAEELADSSEGIEANDGTRYSLEVRQYAVNSADDARDAVEDALDDGADVLIAPLNTSFREAVVEENPSVVVLYYANDDTTPTNAIKIAPSLSSQIRAAADYLTNVRLLDEIAVINADTTAAESGTNVFVTEVGAGSVATRLTHEADRADFAGDARSVRDAGAEAAFIYTLQNPGAALSSALDEIGWDGVVVSMDPPASADGVFKPVIWTASADDRASREFVAAYQARWEELPGDESAAYYDSVYLMAEALRNTESLARTSLTGASLDGVQGTYASGVPDTVRIVELGNGSGNVEAARYVAGVCVTCPGVFVQDITETDTTRELVYTVALIADTDSDTGRSVEQAAELAVREINDAGGLLGPQTTRYTLRLRTYDAANPAEASAAFGQAVQDGAGAVLGGDLNGWVLPAPFTADAAGVPYLVTATGLTSPTLATAQFLLQLRANDLTQARAAVSYAVESLELTQFATVSARADYGLNAARALRDATQSADDGEVVFSVEHAPDQPNLSAAATQVAGAEVEAVFAWTTPDALQSFLNGLGAEGWSGVVFYGYLTDSLAATLTVPEGVTLYGVTPWTAQASDWSSRAFTASYTDLYAEAPSDLAAAYYDAVHLLRRGVEAVGPVPATVNRWLRDTADFTGVQGAYLPSEYGTGELTQTVRVVRVEGGLLVQADRYAICPVLCE